MYFYASNQDFHQVCRNKYFDCGKMLKNELKFEINVKRYIDFRNFIKNILCFLKISGVAFQAIVM